MRNGGMRRSWLRTLCWVAVAILLAACGGSEGKEGRPTLRRPCPEPVAVAAPALPPDARVVRVMAGSELREIEPLLAGVEASLGIDLQFEFVGSLEGAERIAAGTKGFDLAWFSSSLYLEKAPDSPVEPIRRASIMRTPVILGVKQTVADKLGWADGDVSWEEIERAASQGSLHFAMTDPTSSNSGFGALVAAATALSGGQLAPGAINGDALARLFIGHKLTARTSGFLADHYMRSQRRLHGLVNYESVLIRMNADPALGEKLQLIYPTEGVVTADYPLLLLDADRQELFGQLALALKEESLQCRFAREAGLRPVIEDLDPDVAEFRRVPKEIALPVSGDVLDQLLFTYLDRARRPSTVVYVLDTSGSMADKNRIGSLRDVMLRLTAADGSLTGRFSRFRLRERVVLLPFSTVVGEKQVFEIKGVDGGVPDTAPLAQAIQGLSAEGDTALFDALLRGLQIADEERRAYPNRFVSVVLLTDGRPSPGTSSFAQFNAGLTENLRAIKTFTIAFGTDLVEDELAPAEAVQAREVLDALDGIAERTDGEFIDDTKVADLGNTFEKIRGSQ